MVFRADETKNAALCLLKEYNLGLRATVVIKCKRYLSALASASRMFVFHDKLLRGIQPSNAERDELTIFKARGI